eukprot:TRINITY_DN19878_c0_g1_i3.p1 TRINITY_DN19878_c0_g1~~TRINITY_DN19878_c0_g1_i3.p1  ORF type:complete len:708 (+),score=110.66 TRINITY_DN19878_c0_g1_i3:148-2271(+)
MAVVHAGGLSSWFWRGLGTASSSASSGHTAAAGAGAGDDDLADYDYAAAEAVWEAAGELTLEEYGESLGLDPDADADLMWMARVAAETPVPSSWAQHVDDEGRCFYHNELTQESSWLNPVDELFGDMIRLVRSLRAEQPPPSRARRRASLEEHLVTAHRQALAGLEDWSGPYYEDDVEQVPYYYNKVLDVSSWEDPTEALDGNLTVRQRVLHRCLLLEWPEDQVSSPSHTPSLARRQGALSPAPSLARHRGQYPAAGVSSAEMERRRPPCLDLPSLSCGSVPADSIASTPRSFHSARSGRSLTPTRSPLCQRGTPAFGRLSSSRDSAQPSSRSPRSPRMLPRVGRVEPVPLPLQLDSPRTPSPSPSPSPIASAVAGPASTTGIGLSRPHPEGLDSCPTGWTFRAPVTPVKKARSGDAIVNLASVARAPVPNPTGFPVAIPTTIAEFHEKDSDTTTARSTAAANHFDEANPEIVDVGVYNIADASSAASTGMGASVASADGDGPKTARRGYGSGYGSGGSLGSLVVATTATTMSSPTSGMGTPAVTRDSVEDTPEGPLRRPERHADIGCDGGADCAVTSTAPISRTASAESLICSEAVAVTSAAAVEAAERERQPEAGIAAFAADVSSGSCLKLSPGLGVEQRRRAKGAAAFAAESTLTRRGGGIPSAGAGLGGSRSSPELDREALVEYNFGNKPAAGGRGLEVAATC